MRSKFNLLKLLHGILDQGTIEYCMQNKVFRAVSTVEDGNMSRVWGDPEVVRNNRVRFFEKHGLKYPDSVFAYLTSGTDIQIAGAKDMGSEFKCDSIITTERGVVLALCAADCLPVTLADEAAGVLALAHLGWRGVDGKLVRKTIEKMTELGAETDQISVWIGPGVRKETYIKSGEKLSEFWNMVNPDNKAEWKLFMQRMPGSEEKYGIDLAGYAIYQMQGAGVELEKIKVSEIDTIADRNYFSHYRMAGVIKPSTIDGTGEEREGRFVNLAVLI